MKQGLNFGKLLLASLFGVFALVARVEAAPDAATLAFLNDYGYQHIAGSAGVSSSLLDTALYSSGLTKCNSSGAPSHENNCPSDLLYTPNSYTGGYQSWGVGLSNWPHAYYLYPVCGFYWWYDIDGDPYPVFDCYFYIWEVVDHAVGTVVGRSEFGANTTSTPWGNRPASTLAFKANNSYTPPDSSVTCNPNWVMTFAAPCGSFEADVYAVPDVGYEDKVIMTDVSCNPPLTSGLPFAGTRSGTWQDAYYNCFEHDGESWMTNLPAPYPDTTLFDPGASYRPAFGSADPEQLIEGYLYTWVMNFFQLGLEDGNQANKHYFRHMASITTEIEIAPGCTVDGSDPWDCYFSVDQTPLAPQVTYP